MTHKDVLEPALIALDVGSTASRGILVDPTGRQVGKRVKVPHAFTSASDGTSTIDPDQVADEIATILDGLTEATETNLAAVAMDTFASSLIGVDEHGNALTPCYTYADGRCAAWVTRLREELDEHKLQQRTGTRLHSSYLAPRLLWLRDTAPEVFGRVSRWLSLGEYVQLKLFGATACGTPTAAWTGMLDRLTGHWDAELLMVAGVPEEAFSPIQDPGVPIAGADASRWPRLAGAAVLPTIADGLGANFGIGAGDGVSAGLSASTSGAVRVVVDNAAALELPGGLWGYRIDAGRSLLGGAINDVGRVVDWCRTTLQLGDLGKQEALLIADPSPHTPVMLPFLTGERSTGWAAGATATFAGVTASTTAADLFRGAAEGIAISYARIVEQLLATAPGIGRVVATGGVGQDLPHLLQIIADVVGRPLEFVNIRRSTVLGTALLALESVAPEVERAPVPTAGSFEPRPAFTEHYHDVRRRFEEIYPVAVGG
ncbi:gluconokinase [Nocardioides sp.]|uniref:gluconokinase n=1 Tax=Nocardioides sp. TaxID=35761 RepID=UPI0039E30EE0